MRQIYLDWAVGVGRNRDFPQQSSPVRRHLNFSKGGTHMDRLRQISAEIIRLYRKQLNVWVLGKIPNLKDADLLQYDRRRDRIAELRKELESMARAA
jgi:hypothetical protein